MDLNIYSEPLFPISQGLLSSSSSSASSTQVATNVIEDLGSQLKEDDGKLGSIIKATQSSEDYEYITPTDCDGSVPGDYKKSQEEVEAEVSEEEEEFSLESVIIKCSELKQKYCTFGCVNLDKHFSGGVPTFGITEFVGGAGTGKTQFCLQLAITAQLPENHGGLDSGVYYICTEGPFPSKRLAEIISHLHNKFPNDVSSKVKNAMNNIYVDYVNDIESLATSVEVRLPMFLRQNPSKKIRMVILDSVAGIFRYEYEDISKRTYELRQLAQNLHEFSHENQAAIVVSNQVTANPDLETNVAALGMAWKNMVTTRICLSKDGISNRRLLTVNFSPHIPSVEISYQIASDGIKGILV